MGRRLEEFREWLTPRKRLWSGLGLFAFVIVVTAKYPESGLTWLIGPAAVLITGSFMGVQSDEHWRAAQKDQAALRTGTARR